MGDGVLVYFGYPEAHEDDPERLIKAEIIAKNDGMLLGHIG
jgi:class 3 adenylate cyclase